MTNALISISNMSINLDLNPFGVATKVACSAGRQHFLSLLETFFGTEQTLAYVPLLAAI